MSVIPIDFKDFSGVRISSKGEYALHALLDITVNDGQALVQAPDIARRTGIPVKYLEQVLLALKAGGLIDSKRGVGGGYALAKPPQEITLSEVLDHVEGSLEADCTENRIIVNWANQQAIVVKNAVCEARRAMLRVLQSTSLADLAARARDSEEAAYGQPMYHI
mgnify:CR=1 FL=1